jgi:hypothetical protein
MKQKMTIKIDGIEFQIPAKSLQKDYNGNDIIRLGSTESASILKQYVKKKYPSLETWSSSDKYAGGESATIWVCNTDGTAVPNEIYKDIDWFSKNLEAGTFNGMEDIYEYKNDSVTDTGIPITNYTKYVFVNNRPKHGSPLSIMQSLKGMMAGEYDFGVVDLQTAIAKMKRFGYKDAELDKGVNLLIALS